METRDVLQRHKTIWIGLCLTALSLVYVFQRVDYLGALRSMAGAEGAASPYETFIFNKSLRLVLNDLICMAMIAVLFRGRKYLRVAFVIFCFEFFVVLPFYLFLKLRLEGSSEISSPLLSQIHRLIVNPMLMLLLMVAFYYQRYTDSTAS